MYRYFMIRCSRKKYILCWNDDYVDTHVIIGCEKERFLMDKVLRDTCQLVTAFNVHNLHVVVKVSETMSEKILLHDII